MNKKDIATFAIDENSVEHSPYDWEGMFYKQLQVPFLLFALILMLMFSKIDGPIPLMVWVAIGIPLAYSFWPAIGAYWYWRIE